MAEETAVEVTPEQALDAAVEAAIDPSIDAAGANEGPMGPTVEAPEPATEPDVAVADPVADVPEPATTAEPSGGRSAEVERAITALRLKGSAPEQVFEGMTDDAILGWAGKVATNSVEVDRAFIERAAAQKELKEFRDAQESQQVASPSAEPATPAAPVPDLSETIEPLVEFFGGDDETRKVLANSFGGILNQANERVSQAEAQVKQLYGLVEGQMLGTVRASLVGEYPALADKEYYGRVSKTMRQLDEVGRHEEIKDPTAHIQALMESALRLEDPPPAPPEVDPAVEAAKRNGSPEAPTPSKERKTPEQKLEGEALIDAKIRYIQANRGVDAAAVMKHFGEL